MAEPARKLLARAVIPARCAPLWNVAQRMHWAAYQRLKRECGTRMLAQMGKRAKPLERPEVHVLRWTTRKPDPESTWSKVPVDCLKGKGGLGWLVDDDDEHVVLRSAWERRSENVCVVEVWADEAQGDETSETRRVPPKQRKVRALRRGTQ